MWSKGSLVPSYDSNCGRWNFGRRGWFSTILVNGESILQIIPSKFSPPLSFMALFSLSISFLMLRSSFSTLVESSPKVLSRLLAWEFDSSSFWFHPFANILRFGIPLSFAILHSGESTLPHWPKGLGSVVVAQCLAEVWPLLPSHTLRNSFVTRKDGLND